MSDTLDPAPTAAVLVIGNEILSGRTQDTNLNVLAKSLIGIGIRLCEARVVPDIEAEIIAALNALRARYTYVFTTGGIGPTHDDITAESIAKAFGVPLIENPEARARLEAYYTAEKLTPARLLMARTPQGAELIDNPVSVAPGFRYENVYVMAGVPSIMAGMLDGILGRLRHGPEIHSVTITCTIPESVIAEGLGIIAHRYAALDVGSYPSFRLGKIGLALVVRGTDRTAIQSAVDEICALIREKGDAPEIDG